MTLRVRMIPKGRHFNGRRRRVLETMPQARSAIPGWLRTLSASDLSLVWMDAVLLEWSLPLSLHEALNQVRLGMRRAVVENPDRDRRGRHRTREEFAAEVVGVLARCKQPISYHMLRGLVRGWEPGLREVVMDPRNGIERVRLHGMLVEKWGYQLGANDRRNQYGNQDGGPASGAAGGNGPPARADDEAWHGECEPGEGGQEAQRRE